MEICTGCNFFWRYPRDRILESGETCWHEWREEVQGEVELWEMPWQREIYIYVDDLLNHANRRYQTTFTYLTHQ